jgi:hypothetical protein
VENDEVFSPSAEFDVDPGFLLISAEGTLHESDYQSSIANLQGHTNHRSTSPVMAHIGEKKKIVHPTSSGAQEPRAVSPRTKSQKEP